MRPNKPPPPEPVFRYRTPPRSGNLINGLGEETPRRAGKVFHRLPIGPPEREPKDWAALDRYFNMIISDGGGLAGLAVLHHVMANRWQLRRGNGPVAPARVAVSDPQAMAEQVRGFITARYPEALVGFTGVTAEAVFQGEQVPYANAISIGLPMDRKKMAQVPSPKANREVWRVYRLVSRIAVETSEFIRAMGWPAKASGETKSTELLHIPLALQAGLGQLGKHGSLICEQYGSNFRLAAVVTDLPLAHSQPVDIAVDDLCTSCNRCTLDCPPGAILDTKQMVRGVRKWYVDFDKCVPYFVENGGCAICLEVCPWSEPGRGPGLSRQLLARRAKGRAAPSDAPVA